MTSTPAARTSTESDGGRRAAPPRVELVASLATLLVHLPFLTQYGWFRDELYYVACSRHPAWGYVDQPPLSIAVLSILQPWLSLALLRTLSALTHAVSVAMAGRIAARMGGGPFARGLTCLCVALAPVYLAIGHFWSMNVLDLLLWTLAAWALMRALERGGKQDWIVLGALLGLGLLNKVSMLWFVGGAFLGLLLTPHRRRLATPGPWLAAGVAALLFVPHVLWQVANHWPTLEFVRNATREKMVRGSPLEFLGGQLLAMNPVAAIVWVAGLAWLIVAPIARPWRILGIIWLAVAGLLIASGSSRSEYLSVAYPPLFAAGAVAIERGSRVGAWRWLRVATPAVVGLAELAVAPLAMPLLPIDAFLRYQKALGVTPRHEERSELGELPQHFADMFGWEEMAERAGRAFQSLSPEERARCGVFAQNYGEAGALDWFGPRWGLPRAMSGHNNFWLWGPRSPGDPMIVLGGDLEDNEEVFESVTQVDTIRCEHCMPYERGLEVYVCRGLKVPIAELWPRLKRYI